MAYLLSHLLELMILFFIMQSTFRYGSSHWTTSTVYNDVFALREGLHGQEAKFQGFNTMPFVKVCIGMKVGTTMNFLTLTHSSTSLLNYMKDGTYHGNEISNEYENVSFMLGFTIWLR